MFKNNRFDYINDRSCGESSVPSSNKSHQELDEENIKEIYAAA